MSDHICHIFMIHCFQRGEKLSPEAGTSPATSNSESICCFVMYRLHSSWRIARQRIFVCTEFTIYLKELEFTTESVFILLWYMSLQIIPRLSVNNWQQLLLILWKVSTPGSFHLLGFYYRVTVDLIRLLWQNNNKHVFFNSRSFMGEWQWEKGRMNSWLRFEKSCGTWWDQNMSFLVISTVSS